MIEKRGHVDRCLPGLCCENIGVFRHVFSVLTHALFPAAMLPKPRLGKRSPLGALVSSTCPSYLEKVETGINVATGAGSQATSRVKGHPGLKVSSPLTHQNFSL